MIAHNDRELLSIRDACARAGVSRRTVHLWIASGRVEVIRNPAGRPYIYADTLWRRDASEPDPTAQPAA